MRTKRCSRCDTYKDLDQYASDVTRPDGRNSWCRACMSETSKKRHAKRRAQLSKKTRN